MIPAALGRPVLHQLKLVRQAILVELGLLRLRPDRPATPVRLVPHQQRQGQPDRQATLESQGRKARRALPALRESQGQLARLERRDRLVTMVTLRRRFKQRTTCTRLSRQLRSVILRQSWSKSQGQRGDLMRSTWAATSGGRRHIETAEARRSTDRSARHSRARLRLRTTLISLRVETTS